MCVFLSVLVLWVLFFPNFPLIIALFFVIHLGQNIQLVQLGQPFVMPFQLRPQTVIQNQPQQQQQQQQQNFGRVCLS